MSEETKSRVLVLRADATTPFRDAVVMGQGLPLEKDGVKCAYKWKESLPLGRYLDKHQKPFEVSPQRIENLIRNFNRAKAKGFTPPILDRHEKNGSASFGFVVDARKGANGSLELLHQFVGEDAILASARNKTSVCTVADVTDENGECYDELLDHQALIPDPQLNNLSDFTPALAASRGQSQPAVFLELAASENRSADMALNPELAKQLRQKLGAADDVTDDKLIEQAVAKLGEAVPALELSRTQGGAIATLTQERDAARLELSRAQQKPDAALLTGWADLTVGKVELLLSQGKCTKAQADLLKGSLKEGDAPNALMLSKTAGGKAPVDVALSVLELNASMTGTVTGGQPLPDPNNPAPKPLAPERRAELLAHAGL